MLMKAQSLTFITVALAVGLFLSVGAQGKSQTWSLSSPTTKDTEISDAPEIR